MLTSVRAELVKAAYRPASWLLLAIGAALTLTFGYVVPYVGFTEGGDGGTGLAGMLPRAFVGTAIGGLPLFIGALALIFGVLTAGSEYGLQTWKTVLAQRPSRITAYGAKLAVVAAGTLAGVVTLFALAAASSAVVATAEHQPMVWPSAPDIVTGAGAGWLIAMMWGSLGVLLAVALRSVALPVGLGLVWLLAVQNLLAAVAAPLVHWVAELQKALPGPNAGALAAVSGASASTPGVSAIVGAGHAAFAVVGYLVAFCAVGGLLLHRRDIL